MTDDLTYLVAENDWANLIGHFMLDYANIEDCIHRVIKFHIRQTLIDESHLIDKFPIKLSLFKTIMIEQFVDHKSKSHFESVVKKITELNSTRNVIAHNPLSYHFVEKDGNMEFVGFGISGKKANSCPMDLERFKKEAEKLRNCTVNLSEFMLQFHLAELGESPLKK